MENIFNELNMNTDTWVNHELVCLDVLSLVGGFLCNPPLLGKKTSSKAIDHTYAVRLSPGSIDILMEGIDSISIASISEPDSVDFQRPNEAIRCFASEGDPYFHTNLAKHPRYGYSIEYARLELLISSNGLGLSLPLCWDCDSLSYTIFREPQHSQNRTIMSVLRQQSTQYGASNARLRLSNLSEGRERGSVRFSELTRALRSSSGETISRFRTFNYHERPLTPNPYELGELTFEQFSGIRCLMPIEDYGTLVRRGCFGVFRATNEGLIVDQYNFDNEDPFVGTKKLSGTWDEVPSEDHSAGVSLQTFFQVVKHKRSRLARRSLEQLVEELTAQDIEVTRLIGFSDHGLVLGLEYTNPITERTTRLLRIIRTQRPSMPPRENHTSAPIEVIQEEPEEVEIESPIERLWYEAACRRGGGVRPSDNPKDWFTAYMNENIIQGVTVTEEHLDHYNTLE